MKKTLTIVVAVMLAGVSFAQRIDTTEPAYFKATVNVYGGLYLPASGFYIGGTKVTATAANLNSGVAGSTATSVSNAELRIYGSNIVTVADGATVLGGTLLVTGTTTCYGTATLSNLTAKAVTTVTESTTTRVCTSADYGKLILIVTNAAVAITLPANGAPAGSWIAFAIASRSAILPSTDDCVPTISAATTDTLIGPNDIDLKSVTWGTGHRIGAQAKFWSDGFFWHVQNLGGTTMTYTD